MIAHYFLMFHSWGNKPNTHKSWKKHKSGLFLDSLFVVMGNILYTLDMCQIHVGGVSDATWPAPSDSVLDFTKKKCRMKSDIQSSDGI